MKKQINDLLFEANSEMAKIIGYLNESKKIWNKMRNLKLHDVSYYCYSEMKKDFPLLWEVETNNNCDYSDIFSRYCDSTYSMFVEDMQNNYNIDIKDVLNYVGTTSMFYLTKYHDSYYYGMDCLIYDLMEKFYDVGADYVTFSVTNKYCEDAVEIELKDGYEDFLEDTIEQLEYIINDFFNDIKADLSDAMQVAIYIDTFKENQVADFMEYCGFYEYDLEYEKAEIEKIVEQTKDEIKAIQNKYDISDEDMKTLKKFINTVDIY